MQKSEAAEAKSKVQLTDRQKFEVVDWLRDWQDAIRNGKWTAKRAAEEVTRKVGYPVTEFNVLAIGFDIGVEFHKRTRPPGAAAGQKNRERIVALEKLTALLGEEIALLRAKVAATAAELDGLLAGLLKAHEQAAAREARLTALESKFEKLLTDLGEKKLDKAVSLAATLAAGNGKH